MLSGKQMTKENSIQLRQAMQYCCKLKSRKKGKKKLWFDIRSTFIHKYINALHNLKIQSIYKLSIHRITEQKYFTTTA